MDNNNESFVFKVKEISRKDICLSSFYNYETTEELIAYKKKHGNDKEDVIDVFVNLFPYEKKSVFMMAYKKKEEAILKPHVNEFFSDNERRLERKITNLMLFGCETWVVSNSFYSKHILGSEDFFEFAIEYSSKNFNERKNSDVNIFKNDFISKFQLFKKKNLIG